MVPQKRILSVFWYLLAFAVFFAGAFVFIFFEQAHFDSDQAISGIMAKQLSEGVHFPVFTYGARYVLGFETWLAAPFMYFWGASVATLKLPLLILNLFTVFFLLKLLRQESKLSWSQAFLSASFFILPSPIAMSRVMQAAVGMPTSFLACIGVWFLWESPFVLGLFLAFAVSVRPFVLYAVFALLFLEACEGVLFQKARMKVHSITALIAATGIVLIQIWGHHAPNYKGPKAPPPVIKDPVSFFHSFQWLLTENLPTLYGLKPNRFLDFNITSHLTTGSSALIPFFILAVLVFGLRRFHGLNDFKNRIKRALLAERFASFLMLIGFFSAFVYTETARGAENIMLIRYTVLCLFLPIGYAAFFFRRETNQKWVLAFSATILVWLGLSAFSHFQLLEEYAMNRPENPYRDLTNYLESHSKLYGRAEFWTASHVTFFSKEKILLTESDFARIDEYVPMIAAHKADSVDLSVRTCAPGNSAEVQFQRWCITSFK